MKKWAPPVVALGLVGVALTLARRGPVYASPADCIEAYYAAIHDNDVDRYLGTLGKDARSRKPEVHADLLRLARQGLKNWVLVSDPEGEGAERRAEVDEQRPAGRQRVTFHLRLAGGSWHIEGIDPPRPLPEPVRFGTHVSEAP